MVITIFGATGMVGSELVKHALYLGHQVKAFGRNVYTASLPDNPDLDLITGALFDADQVYAAIQGSDAVLSAIGGAFDGKDKSRSLGMKNIVGQMSRAGVKRIIALGNNAVLPDSEGNMLIEDPDFPRQFIPVGTEHVLAYTYLKASSLEWTFVGAPELIDAPATGLYHVAAEAKPSHDKNKINVGDLCLFMLEELKNNRFLKARVGISN